MQNPKFLSWILFVALTILLAMHLNDLVGVYQSAEQTSYFASQVYSLGSKNAYLRHITLPQLLRGTVICLFSLSTWIIISEQTRKPNSTSFAIGYVAALYLLQLCVFAYSFDIQLFYMNLSKFYLFEQGVALSTLVLTTIIFIYFVTNFLRILIRRFTRNLY